MPTNSNNETISAHDEGEDLPRNVALTSPVAPEQVVAPAAPVTEEYEQGITSKEAWWSGARAGLGLSPDAPRTVVSQRLRAASPEAAPLLMQDENSGRDGRRYNEWHASRPDARLNAREAAAATPAAPSAAGDAYSDPACQRAQMLNRQWDAGFEAGGETALAQPAPVQAGAQQVVVDDECQLVGVKSDGTEHVLGTVTMPPKMKARDIVRSYFGYWDDDDDCCDAAMAMMCCEELIAFMQKPVRVDLAAPTQAEAGDAKGGA